MERQSTRKLFKLVIALVALFTLALSVFAFGACGGEEHKHEYTGSNKTEANCGKIGVETFTCSCGDTYVAVTPATGPHSWDTDGKYCTKCGLPNFGADGIDYSKIPDSFTAEDLDAIKAAITASKGELTKEQQAAHNALGQKIDGLNTHPVHTFSAANVKTLTMPGSCTTYGVKFTLSTCDVCGATFLTGIEKDGKLGHKEKTVTLDPTCQQLGYIQKICETCGELLFTQTLNTVPHEKGPKSETESIPATCTKPGTDKYECKWCHVVQSEWNETVEAPGHAGKPDPKDCTKDEVLSWHCDVCNTDVTENYRAGTHTFGEAVEVTTDCTDNKEGVTVTKTCSVCGFEEVTKKGAAGTHVAYTDEATTTIYVLLGVENANWKKFKAEHPEASDPANLNPPTTEGQDNGYNANNNVVKYTYYLCKTCGKPVQKEAVAECHNFELKTTGHEFNESGDPIAECVTYTLTYKCRDTKCDASYTVTVEGIGHDWSAKDWDAKTGKGELSDGWQFVIDATTKKAKEATCTAEGEAYRYCKRCNPTADTTKVYETHAVSKKDHVLDESKLTGSKAATCTEPGWKKGPCLNCEGTEVTVEIPALGHRYDDPWTPVFDDAAQGLERCRVIAITNTCSECGEVITKEDTDHLFMTYEHKLGHTQVKQEATCTQKGIYAVQCERCGIFGYDSWEEPALGHDMQEVRRDELSCNPTTKEYIYYKCSRCEETKQEELKKLDHVWSEEPYIYDCSVPSDRNGYYCTVCNADYGKKEITDVAKKFNQSLGFLPLEEGNKQFGKEPYKYGAHVLTFSNFKQGALCGSDATFTITCENCKQFQWDGDTHDGTMVLTAEKFKGVTEEWGDVYDFLFKLGDFADREGEAYRPAHVLDKEYDVKYTLVEYLSDAEKAIWATLDNHENCNTLKTVIYVCSGCDDPAQDKKYVAEQHNWSANPVWSQTLNEAPQVVQDALKDLAPSYELVKYEGGKYTLNTHDDTVVTLYWYCNDTSCITVPRFATLEVKWDGNHDWTTENTWDETWTLEQAQEKGWKLIPDDEGKTPNCKESVTLERHCQLDGCDAVEEHVIKGTHDYGTTPTSSKVVKLAHLSEDGLRIDTYTCSVCGETKEVEVKLDATGDHAWLTNPDGSIKWFKDWDGDCVTGSSWHKVCAYPGCGETVSVTGRAPGHEWSKEYTIEATCTSAGMVYRECNVCGEQQIISVTPALGHWYYIDENGKPLDREAAAKMAPDELKLHLNIVGKNESTCLTPDSVTVECVHCGVRYAYSVTGGEPETTGHTWLLIKETVNDNIVCGDFLSKTTLAYCKDCGLVTELTTNMGWTVDENGVVTFDDSNIWGRYIGIENLDETQQAALAALLDKNKNLNVNLKVENPEKTTEETTENYTQAELIDLVVKAFKNLEMIQLHDFTKGEKLYVLTGNCQSPTAYVVLCSRCGHDENGEIVVRADEDIEVEGDKTFYDYMQEYTRDPANGGVQEAYKKLGYKLISTAKNITVTVDDKEVKKSLKDLYIQYVTADVLDLELAEGEKLHAPSSYYTWYNFAAFTYSDEGHDWLLPDNPDCVVDPVLEWLWEDIVGFGSMKAPMFMQGYTGSHLTSNRYANMTTIDERVKEFLNSETDTFANAKWYAAIPDEVKNAKVADYEDVIAAMFANKDDLLAKATEDFKGVSNWCKRSVEEGICDLLGGFKLTVEHASVYRIAKDPKDLKAGYCDGEFTFGLDGKTAFPATAVSKWTKTQVNTWKNDLLFVQFLKDNAAKRDTFSEELGEVYDSYLELKLLANDVIRNKALTCVVTSECVKCGEVGRGGEHQQVLDDPWYGGNCQRGPRCVVCGESLGQKGAHQLVNILDYYNAIPEEGVTFNRKDNNTGVVTPGSYTKEELQQAIKDVVAKGLFTVVKETGKPAVAITWDELSSTTTASECWLQGKTSAYGELKVCTGCLEAAIGLLGPDYSKQTITWSSTGDYNYSIKWNKEASVEGVGHIFTLTEENVAKLVEKFPDLFTNVKKGEEKAKIIELVNSYVYDVTTTDAKYTVTAKVDEDDYLVLHYAAELTGDNCQATSWDEDLCFTCALHFATEQADGKYKVMTSATGFGIRTAAGEGEAATKHPATQDGHYNDNKAQTKHVYAPRADWTYDEKNKEYVGVVCLRCGKEFGGKLPEIKAAHKDGMYYYFGTVAELQVYCTDTSTKANIPDGDKFYKDGKFVSEKAKDYDGGYSYANDATEAATAIGALATAEKGGIVELAAGLGTVTLGSTLSVSGKDAEIDLNGNTLALGANCLTVAEGGSLTVKGGELTGSAEAIQTQGEANVTLEDVTFKSDTAESGLNFNISGTAGTDEEVKNAVFTIKNSVIATKGYTGIWVNGNLDGATLKIENSVIVGSETGLEVAGDTTVVATNSTFAGGSAAVQINSGTSTFTGCTFIGANKDNGGTEFAGGNTYPVAVNAILVVAAKGGNYDSPVAVTLSGSKFVKADKTTGIADATAEGLTEIAQGTLKSGYFYKAATAETAGTVNEVSLTVCGDATITFTTDTAVTLKLGVNVFVYDANRKTDKTPDTATNLNDQITYTVKGVAGTIAPKGE